MSVDSMSADWSMEQKRILSALGYGLYRPVATPAAPGMPVEPLLVALLHAAGLDAAAMADAEGWLRAQQVASLALLRTDPSAKRALWPRLRALRRGVRR